MQIWNYGKMSLRGGGGGSGYAFQQRTDSVLKFSLFIQITTLRKVIVISALKLSIEFSFAEGLFSVNFAELISFGGTAK